MKPPVNIDDLMDMWTKDSPVDITEPSRELERIPSLHSKYLKIMTHHNLVVKKLMSEYQELRRIKFNYYSGDLNNPEDLEKYGYEPMMKKVLRSEVSVYLDSDKELNTLLLKKSLHEEIVDFCKAVLKELGNRTFQIRSIIDWEKFVGGS